jgi:hypothetical protein
MEPYNILKKASEDMEKDIDILIQKKENISNVILRNLDGPKDWEKDEIVTLCKDAILRLQKELNEKIIEYYNFHFSVHNLNIGKKDYMNHLWAY